MPLPSGLELTWFGHATFLLTTPRGTRVLIDPWMENPANPEDRRDPGDVDVILVTHGHSDHTGSLIDLARSKRPQATIAMIEIGDWLEGSHGIENVVGMNKGGTVEAAGVRFTMVHADHSSSWTNEDGTNVYLGEAAGYIITLEDGTPIYFAGDTDVFGDMRLLAELYEPQIAVLPIGDYFTMGPKQAAKAIELLGVKTVVPMHYGTFPLLTGTPEALRGLVGGEVEILEGSPGGRVG